jgi:hypothetical protein
VAQAHRRESLSQGLQQIHRLTPDYLSQLRGELAVMHRRAKIVARCGRMGIELELYVYDEILTFAALEVEDAMVTTHGQASQADPIQGRRIFRSGDGGPGGRTRETIASLVQ